MAKYVIEIPDEVKWIQMYIQNVTGVYGDELKEVDTLTPYTEPDEQEIIDKAHDEAWEFMANITKMSTEELRKYFPDFDWSKDDFYAQYSYSEAKARYDKWETEKEQIRVGDELVSHLGKPYIIYHIDRERGSAYGINFDKYPLCQECFPIKDTYTPNRTGRRFPEVTELFEKMREE